MNPKISVIVPVYNVEPYIRQCLDSIVNQTYKNLEIILIDDGSPDNCEKICDEYAAKDKRIFCIHKENKGVSAARNDGIGIAIGDWTTFADPDDWYDEDYFENMVNSLPVEETEVFLAGGCYAEDENESKQVRTFGKEQYNKNIHNRAFLLNKTLAPRYGMGDYPTTSALGVPWNKLYKTAFLRENGIFFPLGLHPGEEVLFNVAVFRTASNVAACDCIGYHYRTQVESSSLHRYNANWPKMSERFMNELFRLIGDGKELEISRDAINARAFLLIFYELNCHFFHPSNSMQYKDIVCEIDKMKAKPYFHDAIYTTNNLVKGKRCIVKFLLRFPWIWPIWAAFRIKNILQNVGE